MYLKRHFVTKNMRRPKYFLGIEVAYQNTVYALNLLEETCFLGCKPANTPIEANVHLWFKTARHLMIQEDIKD